MDGFVLAGGQSTRMGVDKARIPFPLDEPMAIATARILARVCERVFLVRRGPPDGLPWRLDGLDLEVIRDAGDDEQEAHPLHGVVAGLEAARSRRAMFVPCDVPQLTEDDLRSLDIGGPCVASDGQRRHPLVAVYPREWRSRAATFASEGRSVREFAADAESVVMSADHLANFNRWQDTGRKGPVRALLDRLAGLGDPEQIAAGELGRLANEGVIDPEQAFRYARLRLGESP